MFFVCFGLLLSKKICQNDHKEKLEAEARHQFGGTGDSLGARWGVNWTVSVPGREAGPHHLSVTVCAHSSHGFKVGKSVHVCVCYLLSCVQLCDPMDCSPLGSSVYGILQARILEWVAISLSRESSQPRD